MSASHRPFSSFMHWVEFPSVRRGRVKSQGKSRKRNGEEFIEAREFFRLKLPFYSVQISTSQTCSCVRMRKVRVKEEERRQTDLVRNEQFNEHLPTTSRNEPSGPGLVKISVSGNTKPSTQNNNNK